MGASTVIHFGIERRKYWSRLLRNFWALVSSLVLILQCNASVHSFSASSTNKVSTYGNSTELMLVRELKVTHSREMQQTHLNWKGNKTPDQSPEHECEYNELALNVYFTTDTYGGEFYLMLQNSPYANAGMNETMGPYKFRDSTPHHVYACLSQNGCYNLTVGDLANDGMCCDYVAPSASQGYYQVIVEGTAEKTGGIFTVPEYTIFGDCSSPINPSPAPMMVIPSPVPAPMPVLTSPLYVPTLPVEAPYSAPIMSPPTCTSPSGCSESCCYHQDLDQCHCMPKEEEPCLAHAFMDWYAPHANSCGNMSPEVQYCAWTVDQLISQNERIPDLEYAPYSEFKYGFMLEVNDKRVGYPDTTAINAITVKNVLLPQLEENLTRRLTDLACDKPPSYRSLELAEYSHSSTRRMKGGFQLVEGDSVLAITPGSAMLDSSVQCPEIIEKNDSKCFGVAGVIRLHHILNQPHVPDSTKDKYEAAFLDIIESGWMSKSYDGIVVPWAGPTEEGAFVNEAINGPPPSVAIDSNNTVVIASSCAVAGFLLLLLLAFLVQKRRSQKRQTMMELKDKVVKELEMNDAGDQGTSGTATGTAPSWKNFNSDIHHTFSNDSGDNKISGGGSNYLKGYGIADSNVFVPTQVEGCSNINQGDGFSPFADSAASLGGSVSLPRVNKMTPAPSMSSSVDTDDSTSRTSQSPPPMLQPPVLDSPPMLSQFATVLPSSIRQGNSTVLGAVPRNDDALIVQEVDTDQVNRVEVLNGPEILSSKRERTKKIRWAPSFLSNKESNVTEGRATQEQTAKEEAATSRAYQDRVNRTAPRRQEDDDGYESFVFEPSNTDNTVYL